MINKENNILDTITFIDNNGRIPINSFFSKQCIDKYTFNNVVLFVIKTKEGIGIIGPSADDVIVFNEWYTNIKECHLGNYSTPSFIVTSNKNNSYKKNIVYYFNGEWQYLFDAWYDEIEHCDDGDNNTSFLIISREDKKNIAMYHDCSYEYLLKDWHNNISTCGSDNGYPMFYTISQNGKLNIFEYGENEWGYIFDPSNVVTILSDTQKRTNNITDSYHRFLFIDNCKNINDIKTYKKVSLITGKRRDVFDIYAVEEHKISNDKTLYLLKTKYFRPDGDEFDNIAIIKYKYDIYCADKYMLDRLFYENNFICNHDENYDVQSGYCLLDDSSRKKILQYQHDIFAEEYDVTKEYGPVSLPYMYENDVNCNLLFCEDMGFAYDIGNRQSLEKLDNATLFMKDKYMFFEDGDTEVIVNMENGKYADYEKDYIKESDVILNRDGKKWRYDYFCNNRYLIVEHTEYRRDRQVKKIHIYDLKTMSYVEYRDYYESSIFDLNCFNSFDLDSIQIVVESPNGSTEYHTIDANENYPSNAKYYLCCDDECSTNYFLHDGCIIEEDNED